MTAPRLVLLLGTLALASCGQQAATPQATAPAASAPAATTNLDDAQLAALRARIAEMQGLRDDVRAGRVPAPVDDHGQALDLDQLVRTLQADLQEGLQPRPLTAAADSARLGAQAAPYAVTTYTIIASTDTFRSRYSTLRSAFPRFNWSNDGCSGPSGYTGWSDEFLWPCVQHDFGYRNARFYSSRMNETDRHWVDGQFKQHMQQVCDTLGWRKPFCYVAAQAFYTAVYFGGKSSYY
ncbi:hypothetical protein HNQ07_001536 [Deinococcus metalli]|uniref:Phospholipase n=1 Tax=Deinococcus metalli TaxID=1141878 RepID=A0A7W8KGG0_9DEIO|nr:phospholipase A2 [Deinococcus metalli]MBB5376079.1 hypothetical protein [Deinococcus metalli]GHF40962.1 hypothetical protein GCM10017781_17040 [Deinococcus metalli]